jgi:hypothetical protein
MEGPARELLQKGEGLSTVDLLIKTGCFVKKRNVISGDLESPWKTVLY